MIRKTAVILACLFLALCFIVPGEAMAGKKFHEKYDGAISTAREEMWKAITSGLGSGATIAIMDRGRFVMAEGIGVADRASNRPVDVDTRFNIGSTSKMFVSVALLLLVDEGKIRLEDPVIKYIPEFRMRDPRYSAITVRMLVNHTSGLPGSSFYFGYEVDPDLHKMLLDTLADSWLKHDPGAMSIYCNDGFTLAEIVVERASGEKYMDFLARRIFKPLGMNHTGPSLGELQHENTAEYYNPKTAKKYPREVIMVYACGGLSSTASDMCRFCNSFTPYGKKLLSDASLKLILSPESNPFFEKLEGTSIGNGFGWDYAGHPIFAEKGFNVLAKSGGSTCYTSYMHIIPEQGLIVCHSISGTGTSSEAISRRIMEALMRANNLPAPEKEPARKPAEPRAIPEKYFDFAGFYANDTAVIKVSFDAENKKCELLSAAECGPGARPLATLVFDGEYFADNAKGQRYYFTDIGGESYLVCHRAPNYGMERLAFQKMKDIAVPQKLFRDINGRKWLVRNADAATQAAMFDVKTSVVYEGLPGYVDLGGIKKIETPTYAGIAATSFRDQFSLELTEKDGALWARTGFFLYTDAGYAKKVRPGLNRVFIGKEGSNEWLSVEKGAVLSFDKPEKGRVIIYAGEPIYDSVIDSGEVYAPEGSFVFFAGSSGDLFKMEAK